MPTITATSKRAFSSPASAQPSLRTTCTKPSARTFRLQTPTTYQRIKSTSSASPTGFQKVHSTQMKLRSRLRQRLQYVTRTWVLSLHKLSQEPARRRFTNPWSSAKIWARNLKRTQVRTSAATRLRKASTSRPSRPSSHKSG